MKLVQPDDLVETFLTMSFVTNTPLKLIRYFIEDEFQTNKGEEPSILRESSIAAKLIRVCMMKLGKSYLQELWGDIITHMIQHERKVSYEINPR